MDHALRIARKCGDVTPAAQFLVAG